MNGKTIMIGAGGHAKVVLDCLENIAYGFLDDEVDKFYNLKKLETVQAGYKHIISFGGVTTDDLMRRHQIFTNYKSQEIEFTTAIHKSAIIAKSAEIGIGCMVGPGAIINSGAKIGENVIINSGVIIEHDVIIAAGSHIAPGAIILGNAKIGEVAMVGAGSVVLPSAQLSNNNLVKALTRFPR